MTPGVSILARCGRTVAVQAESTANVATTNRRTRIAPSSKRAAWRPAHNARANITRRSAPLPYSPAPRSSRAAPGLHLRPRPRAGDATIVPPCSGRRARRHQRQAERATLIEFLAEHPDGGSCRHRGPAELVEPMAESCGTTAGRSRGCRRPIGTIRSGTGELTAQALAPRAVEQTRRCRSSNTLSMGERAV